MMVLLKVFVAVVALVEAASHSLVAVVLPVVVPYSLSVVEVVEVFAFVDDVSHCHHSMIVALASVAMVDVVLGHLAYVVPLETLDYLASGVQVVDDMHQLVDCNLMHLMH